MAAVGETRITAEARGQVATVIDGREYRASRGVFTMPAEAAAKHRIAANLPAPSAALPVGRTGGYRCENPACGFGSFFTACSRCGGPCAREAS